MATIIITGSRGQLGRAITDAIGDNNLHHRLILTDHEDLDIRDANAVDIFLEANPADFLINCAAFTAVDQAEEDPDAAFKLNTGAVATLSSACSRFNIKLIHISTDYVFDGNASKPYAEEHQANPQSVYGKSKYEGETSILYNTRNAIIIRTSWLYYHGGKNFISTILRKASENVGLKVVYDQIGAPTYALDLALFIIKLITLTQPKEEVVVYHYANRGVTSWYDFAQAIAELSGISCKIDPCETSSLKQLATRPAYSVMNCSRAESATGIEIPYWRDSLKKYLEKEKEAYQKQ
jgi:dTDP-4-dehydrorhamnose reductase